MAGLRKWILLVVLVSAGVLAVWAGGRVALKDRVGPRLSPGDDERSLVFDGRERSYLLHVPPGYDGRTPLPLVIVIHGGGGTPESAVRMTGFTAKADREAFIVVYPAGTGKLEDAFLTWNAWNCCGYALDNKVDDVGFINALVGELEGILSVDGSRIFATGISNGGMMSYRLGCELSERIATIAPVAGALNTETCTPSRPVSVIVFHGTADMHVLYEGGAPIVKSDPHPRTDNSVAYAITTWVKNDGCSPVTVRTERGNITTETYSECAGGTEVSLYTIKGGKHSWPGGERSSTIGDEPTTEISATDIIWDFFTRHPKPNVTGAVPSAFELAMCMFSSETVRPARGSRCALRCLNARPAILSTRTTTRFEHQPPNLVFIKPGVNLKPPTDVVASREGPQLVFPLLLRLISLEVTGSRSCSSLPSRSSLRVAFLHGLLLV